MAGPEGEAAVQGRTTSVGRCYRNKLGLAAHKTSPSFYQHPHRGLVGHFWMEINNNAKNSTFEGQPQLLNLGDNES